MARWMKCPLPPAPPPPPLHSPSPCWTPLPPMHPLRRRQGGQGRIDDITGWQGTSHCSCIEHCFLLQVHFRLNNCICTQHANCHQTKSVQEWGFAITQCKLFVLVGTTWGLVAFALVLHFQKVHLIIGLYWEYIQGIQTQTTASNFSHTEKLQGPFHGNSSGKKKVPYFRGVCFLCRVSVWLE